MSSAAMVLLSCALHAPRGAAQSEPAGAAAASPSGGVTGVTQPESAAVSGGCAPPCASDLTCVAGRCAPSCTPACPAGAPCPRAGECAARPIASQPALPELAFPTAGHHRHDGFFLRMTFGAGWGSSELDGSGVAEQVWFGPGFASSFDLGAAVFENLIVHVRLRDASITWPTLTFDGEARADQTGVLASQAMVGVGIQYYFMPINLFVGLALGLAGAEAVVEQRETWDMRYNGGTGFGLDLEVGREWWVSENWALGIAARLSLARVPVPDDAGASAHFEAGFATLLFSATYQ